MKTRKSIISLILTFALLFSTAGNAFAALLETPTNADFALTADNSTFGVGLNWGTGPGSPTKYKVYRRLPVANGTLVVEASDTTPASDILIEGSSVAKYTFTATDEDFVINRLNIINDLADVFGDPVATTAITGVYIEEESNPGGYHYLSWDNDSSMLFDDIGYTVTVGDPLVLIISVDINDLTSDPDLSGKEFRLGIQSIANDASTFSVTGQTSLVVDNDPVITYQSSIDPYPEVGSFVVRKSKLDVTRVAGLGTGLNDGPNEILYGVIITPDAAGDISLGRMVFDVASSGLTDGGDDVNTFEILKDSSLLGADVTIYCTDDTGANATEIKGSDGLEDCDGGNGDGIADGSYKVIISFNAEQSISGSTKYELEATVSGSAGGESLTFDLAAGDDNNPIQNIASGSTCGASNTTLCSNGNGNTGRIYDKDSDEAIFGNNDANGTDDAESQQEFSQLLGSARNFIWSDQSDASYTYPTVSSGSVTIATGSPDWTNGYLLDLDGVSSHGLSAFSPIHWVTQKLKNSVHFLANVVKSLNPKPYLVAFWNNLRGVDLSIPSAMAVDTTEFQEITEVTGTSYRDTTGEVGVSYDYIVEAIDDSGGPDVVTGYSNIAQDIEYLSDSIPITVCASGCDYTTIQAAIDVAFDGDVVEVQSVVDPGSNPYDESLTIDKEITLAGPGSSDAVVRGAHTVTKSNVSISGFTLAPVGGGAGTIITIDPATAPISNVSITSNIFDMNTSPSTGVNVGGNCFNLVSNVIMSNNTFNGPTDMDSNPWKIGGTPGAGSVSCDVNNVDFVNNVVNHGSILLNLNLGHLLSDILINGNTFRNTDGVVSVWGTSTPDAILSDFTFTYNDVDSSNSYGVGIDANDVFTDANFTGDHKINFNRFEGIPGKDGFDAVSILSTGLSTHTIDATKNWWLDENGISNPEFVCSDLADSIETNRLVGLWHLDGTTYQDSDSITDESTYLNNGTLNTGDALEKKRLGVVNSGIRFDGSDDYIEIPHDSSLNIIEDLTISAWIKTTGINGGIFSHHDSSDPWTGYGIEVDGSGKLAYWSSGNDGNFVSGDSVVNNGSWNHVLVTVSGTTVTFYLNGVSDGVRGITAQPAGFIGPAYIGDVGTQTKKFEGFIDEVMVWSGSLTEPEITSLYNALDDCQPNFFSDNVLYDPWYTSSSMLTLSDTTSTSAVYSSTTEGQADFPDGTTNLQLSDDTVLDVSGGVSEVSGTSITVGGELLSLNGGVVATVNLNNSQDIGGVDVDVTQAVQLQSGTNGTPITLRNSNFGGPTLAIPDDTTVLAPSTWDGTIAPPSAGTSDGTAPSSFTVGSTVVEVGSSTGVLLFDQPVTVLINGSHDYVGYKPTGSNAWTQITSVCGNTFAAPDDPTAFPGECFISSETQTKILTYHLTTFGNLYPVAVAAPVATTTTSYSTGGGGSSAAVAPPSGSNAVTSSVTTFVSSVLEREKTYSQPIQISSNMIRNSAIYKTKTAQITGEGGVLTLKPNIDASISIVIPENTSLETSSRWDGKINPPIFISAYKVGKDGDEIDGSSKKLFRRDIAAVVQVGSSKEAVELSQDVIFSVPLENAQEGSTVSIYFSTDGELWTFEEDVTVENGRVLFDTDHFSYFAFENKEDYEDLHGSAPLSRFVESVDGIAFEDISGHWAEDYINEIAQSGVVSGKNPGEFAPNDLITRAEITKMAINAFSYEVSDVEKTSFLDVDPSKWYAPYVQAAKNNGIVMGVNGSFMPNEPVNRAAALKILIEAAGFDDVFSNYQQNYAGKEGWKYVFFPDVRIGEWHSRYVAYARDLDIVGGYDDGNFKPNRHITRAEVAKIVIRIMELLEE